MATPPTLPRPGVKVYTEFRTTTVTPIKPQLPSCVMGVAKEVIEAVQNDGTLNASSLVPLPARVGFPFVGAPYEYTGLGGDTLQLSLSNGPTQTITFPASPANPTVYEVKAYIDGLAIPGLLVDIEESGGEFRVVLRLASTGPFASIAVVGGTALTQLDLRGGGYRDVGASGYGNWGKSIFGLSSYPNPRLNLDQLTIDYSTVRAFLSTGGGNFTEVSDDSTFLRGATAAVSVVDDGDGDNLSPYLAFAGQSFTDGAARITGSADLSATFGALNTTSAIFSVDGGAPITVNFAALASAANVITAINTALGATIASLGAGNLLVMTSPTTGPGSSIERTGGTSSAGNLGIATGTYAAGSRSIARTQGNADLTALVYGASGTFDPSLSLLISIDGGPEQTILFSTSLASAANIITTINTVLRVPSGTAIASLNGNNRLVIKSANTEGGEESTIRINPLSTALTALGLTSGRYAGNAYAPAIGDEVFADGLRLGLITEVTPSGNVTRLRLDTEYLLTRTWVNFSIRALNLEGQQSATRPSADLFIDPTSGEIVVKHELLRTAAGVPTAASSLNLYLAFVALRRDVSAVGRNSNLLRIASLTGIEDALSPISPENPLGLGMFFSLLNSPGLEATGLGISAASADEVYGTLGAWAEAFEFIESKDVYAIAPLTHAIEVADIANAHVTAMSDPEIGLERMVFFNPSRPTRNASVLIGSGSTGNSSGGVSTFDTGLASLPALLAAEGYPAPPYTIDDRIFLRLDDDTNNYLVTSVSGSIVTVSTGALAAGASENNLDGFYFTGSPPAFGDPVVDRPFAVSVRGTVLANLTEEALAYGAIPQGFTNRRMVFTTPDTARATIDGLEQAIEGFYICAALAGRTASKNPQDPLTNVGIAGFKGLIGATDRYGEIQLRYMDGAGLWSMYQEAEGQNIRTRHQLTSDMSSIEKMEFSILTSLDYTAKFLRGGMRNFIGNTNITQNLQSSASTVLEGLGSFLVSNGVLAKFRPQKLIQDPANPTALAAECLVKVFYPCNEILLTIAL